MTGKSVLDSFKLFYEDVAPNKKKSLEHILTKLNTPYLSKIRTALLIDVSMLLGIISQ